MKSILSKWLKLNIVQSISVNKLIFVETGESSEDIRNIMKYRAACRSGRGAIFLAISGGKLVEGVQFGGPYGRCLLHIGVPYHYNYTPILESKVQYMKHTLGITPKEYGNFHAMKRVACSTANFIANQDDYSLVILADKVYIYIYILYYMLELFNIR